MIGLGKTAMTLFPLLAATYPDNKTYASLAEVAPVLYGCALIVGLMLWGLGVWWMFQAVMTVVTHYLTFDMAFNVYFYPDYLCMPFLTLQLTDGCMGYDLPTGESYLVNVQDWGEL